MYDFVSTKFNLSEEEFKNLKVSLSQRKSHIEPSILDSFFIRRCRRNIRKI